MSLNRRKEREIVFQMLFAAQFSPEVETAQLYETLTSQWDLPAAAQSEYIKKAFCGAREYGPVAWEKISANARGWKIDRLSKTTLSILQLALFEMEQMDEIPTKIAINEAVELAKRFDEEGSRRFVNGILGALAER